MLSFLIATCSSPKFHIDRRPLQDQCLTWEFAGAPAQKLMRSHWQRRTRRWASLDMKIMLDAHLNNHFNHFTSKCWAFPNFMYIVLVDIVDSDAIRCLAGVQACCLGWICHSNQCSMIWFVWGHSSLIPNDPKTLIPSSGMASSFTFSKDFEFQSVVNPFATPAARAVSPICEPRPHACNTQTQQFLCQCAALQPFFRLILESQTPFPERFKLKKNWIT
jgi:hypothetical protein